MSACKATRSRWSSAVCASARSSRPAASEPARGRPMSENENPQTPPTPPPAPAPAPVPPVEGKPGPKFVRRGDERPTPGKSAAAYVDKLRQKPEHKQGKPPSLEGEQSTKAPRLRDLDAEIEDEL